jgi:hypothetical protein
MTVRFVSTSPKYKAEKRSGWAERQVWWLFEKEETRNRAGSHRRFFGSVLQLFCQRCEQRENGDGESFICCHFCLY